MSDQPPPDPWKEPASPPPAPGAAAPAPVAAAALAVLADSARELLRERRRERRWRLFFRATWLIVVLLVLAQWRAGSDMTAATLGGGRHAAKVSVDGLIAPGTDVSAERVLHGLRTAFADREAAGIILDINSPGGSPVQAGIINDEIRRLKRKHDKKVYAVVEEACASGAYYVAVAADLIYVDKASIVGSIGVLMDGFGFTGTMEKLGVERRLLTAGENKGMLDPFSPQNEKHRAFAKAMIDQIHQQFIAVVKQGRGKRLKETPETFSGLFWNGEEAIKLGLADKTGNLDFVAREVIHAEEVIDYTPKENVAERLAKRFGASIGAGAVRALREMAPPVR